MKCHIPQISWHNRDPVLSIDFQTSRNGSRRIATSGTDSHVLIWLLTVLSDGSNIDIECVAELSRHSKTVNVVRFSPDGEILASADDEAAIILWRQQPRIEGDIFVEDDAVVNKENWTAVKILRGHIDDISDLSWSPDSQFFVTGSVDNTAIIWDVTKGKNLGLLTDHKGFVQGVSWDPLGRYISTLCSDRTLRIFNITTRKVLHRIYKAVLPSEKKKDPQENPPKATRIFYDDTLKSFCRRLSFSPCGQLLIVPTGIIEENEGKFTNGTYIFTRSNLNKPVLCLPTSDKFTLAVRCCPTLFQLRTATNKKDSSDATVESNIKEPVSLFSLPYRVVFAVATQDSILFYDSQQVMPFAKVSNIHYTRLCDLSWSSDGKILMASSTDGYCSFVLFSDGELGTIYTPEVQQEESKQIAKGSQQVVSPGEKFESMDWTLVLEADTNESSDKVQSEINNKKCLTESDVLSLVTTLDEANINEDARDTSIQEAIKEQARKNEAPSSGDSEDFKSHTKDELEDTGSKPGSKKLNEVKAPRRIQLITLSSSVKKD